MKIEVDDKSWEPVSFPHFELIDQVATFTINKHWDSEFKGFSNLSLANRECASWMSSMHILEIIAFFNTENTTYYVNRTITH